MCSRTGSAPAKAFDFIFVDGAHRFDDVLVDFYLIRPSARKVGGLMVLDDIWMASIRTLSPSCLQTAHIRSFRSGAIG